MKYRLVFENGSSFHVVGTTDPQGVVPGLNVSDGVMFSLDDPKVHEELTREVRRLRGLARAAVVEKYSRNPEESNGERQL
jgi:hypothetical protein